MVGPHSSGFGPQIHISPAEFAARSGLSVVTVRRRVRDRSLPAVQPGGPRTRVLIPVDALVPVRVDAPADLAEPKPPLPTTPAPLPGPAPKWRQSAGGR
jgi:hypothetical protein